jgi:DNA protecting protein DprA
MHCPISPAGGGGLIVRREPRAESIEREVAAVRKAGARYLFHDQSDYPALLAELDSAPLIMACRGRLALGHAPCVALVGARNASAAAVKLARDFGAALAEAGFTVVSGLARGIDGAAHEGAFPATIGVIASGINIAYPPQHTELQERIANEGLLVAEQPPGTEPARKAFPFEEPHYRRPRVLHAGGRGRAAIGLADHRAAGGRGGARGDGDPQLSARCARWVAIS